MKTPTDTEVLLCMKRYGGGFASRLADAGLHADEQNLDRIKATWPCLWKKYTAAVKLAQPLQANEPS